MLAAVNVSAGKAVARALGAPDPNAWVAFATQAQWENGGAPRGNNPYNLTDPGRAMTWRPYGQTGWYSGGSAAELHDDFAAFASLAGGSQAAAANYQREGSYGAVLSACLEGAGPIAIAEAIQSSPWSTDHYQGQLAARCSAELAALFAAAAAAKAKEGPVSEQITAFEPPRRGTVPAGTRRFATAAPYPERLPLPSDGYLFDAWVVIDQEDAPHGHFLRTTTAPPDLVASSAVTLDPPIVTVLPPAPPVRVIDPKAPCPEHPSLSIAVAAALGASCVAEKLAPNAGPISAASLAFDGLAAEYGWNGVAVEENAGLFYYVAFRNGVVIAQGFQVDGQQEIEFAKSSGLLPNEIDTISGGTAGTVAQAS